MIETITHMGKTYPAFQARGFAAQFAFPFAQHVCKGKGLDIGCMFKQWAFPGSYPIDISFDEGYHANNLPERIGGWDYVFSSHCAEHLDQMWESIEYWRSKLKKGGVLFLYLPDMNSNTYWRCWNKKGSKHVHFLTPDIFNLYFDDSKDKWQNYFVSSTDLNSSFCVMAEKI